VELTDRQDGSCERERERERERDIINLLIIIVVYNSLIIVCGYFPGF